MPISGLNQRFLIIVLIRITASITGKFVGELFAFCLSLLTTIKDMKVVKAGTAHISLYLCIVEFFGLLIGCQG